MFSGSLNVENKHTIKEPKDKFHLHAGTSGCWLMKQTNKQKTLLEIGVVSWAGLEIHSVWKWDPQGKGRAWKQEVPSCQLLGMEAGEILGPPGETGTCRKPPKA